jgi:hypothetical protein
VAVRRASYLVLVTATVLLGLTGGAAFGASPEGGPLVRVAMVLKASNGLHASLENSQDGTVTLELKKKDQVVTYAVPGHATAAGLKVRFGKLGLIDVAFTPTKTLNSTEPGEGCTGAPRTLREGVYSGTIDFSGERGFTRLLGPRASGSMSVISPWECPEAEATDPFADARLQPRAIAARAGGGKGGSATLAGGSHSCSCNFIAGIVNRRGGARSVFLGDVHEEREGMKILRSTEVRGPASAFAFDRARGRAILHPPRPLTGRAAAESRPHGPALWQSTIEVPILGADPIDTGAHGFVANLFLEEEGD